MVGPPFSELRCAHELNGIHVQGNPLFGLVPGQVLFLVCFNSDAIAAPASVWSSEIGTGPVFTPMNVDLTAFGFDPQPALRLRMESRVRTLQDLGGITSAHVLLGRHRKTKPSYEVQVLLETAGSDLYSVARDRTPEAAIERAVNDLQQKIRHGNLRRVGERRRRK